MNLHLPAVNATLNALATVFLVCGLIAIKGGRRERHKALMIAAFAASTIFLACYLYYHLAIAKGQPTRFNGAGVARVLYFALLITHTVLAVVNLPLVLRTFWLAYHERWSAHKRWAKWTFPIWLYVSVTGVVVYFALYHWNPAPLLP